MKKNIYLLWASFIFCFQAFTHETDSDPHQIVRRAAFDIGSGRIKMQVSDVDVRLNKVINVLFTQSEKVALRESLAKSLDGKLSVDIQNKVVKAISQLIAKAAFFNPNDYHAIATESFRLAKNGTALVKRIKKETGLSVTIVSQEEEGILGFLSAVNEANIDPDQAISWDFGAGSFQITAQCGDFYSVYEGKLGKIPFKNALLKIQGKEDQQSPNPISKLEAKQAIELIQDHMKDIPSELQKKLNHTDAVILAIGIHPLQNMQKNKNFDRHQVLRELKQRLNLDDHAIISKDSMSRERKDAAACVVSNLILTYGIMKSLDIHQVQYVGTEGANAVGTLLSPKYWEK